jgi:putative PIN family toxin of toxin-antitoxin system
MRLVLDTDVMVAAIRSDMGASRRLLVAGLVRRYALVLSVPLAIEYEAVMTRPEHLGVAGLDTNDIAEVLDAVISIAEPVRLAFLWRPRLRDPDDDMVLETAINGRADRLVTFNLRHFDAAVGQFGIIACRPSAALNALEAESRR